MTDKRKSLTDKLREAAKSKDHHDCALFLALRSGKCSKDCKICARDSFNVLADIIERDYIERPRFEDGTAVQFGDKVDYFGKDDSYTVCTITKHPSGAYSLGGEDEWQHFYLEDEMVKRAEPEDSWERIDTESKMNPNDYVVQVMGDESDMTACDAMLKMVGDTVDRRLKLFYKEFAANPQEINSVFDRNLVCTFDDRGKNND